MDTSILYGDTLWGNMAVVINQADDGEENLRKLVRFMQEKAALDAMYSTKMKKLAKSILPETEQKGGPPSTFTHLFTEFHRSLQYNAREYESFSNKIKEQIVRPMNNVLDNHHNTIKGLKQNVNDWQRKFTIMNSNLNRTKTACEKQCLQSGQDRQKHSELLASNNVQPNVLEHSLHTACVSTKRALQCDTAYVRSVHNMRDFREEFDGSIRGLFNKFQVAEYERMLLISQFIKHYLNNETHVVTQQHKHIECTSKYLQENLNPNEDLQQFILHVSTKRVPPPVPRYTTCIGHPMYHEDSHSFLMAEELSKSHEVKEAEGKLHSVFDKIHHHSILDDSDMTILSDLFENTIGRASFLNVLHEYTEQYQSNLEEEDDDEGVIHESLSLMLDKSSFHAMGRVFALFLDCLAENIDFVVMEHVIALASKFFHKPKDSDQTIYLHTLISRHQVWKSVEFWESSFQATLQRRLVEADSQPNSRLHMTQLHANERAETEKEIVFACLTTFVFNMLRYHVDEEYVSKFVYRYGSLHELEEDRMASIMSTSEFVKNSGSK